jgi:hypothetical protein
MKSPIRMPGTFWRRRQRSGLRSLPALALIIAGQLNLYGHFADAIDATHPGECQVCVQLHAQGHGLIAAGLPPLSPIPENHTAAARVVVATSARHGIPGARAPPSVCS